MENQPRVCLIHCEECTGPLTRFTEVSFQRFLECKRQWLELDGCQKDVAIKSTQVVGLDEENAFDFKELAFHRKCYSSFTNKTILNRAELRRKKAGIKRAQTTGEAPHKDVESPIPKKILRSTTHTSTICSGATTSSRSEHVLPPICIICQKEKLFCFFILIRFVVAHPYLYTVHCQLKNPMDIEKRDSHIYGK